MKTSQLLLLLPICCNAFAPSKSFSLKKKISTQNLNAVPLEPLHDVATNILNADVSMEAPTYSKASYYTTLGLYAMSFPGVWSAIKRSTKAKTKRFVF